MKEIKKALLENPQSIKNILSKLNFYKVKINNYSKEITCCNSEKGKGSSIHIKLDETLLSTDFKYGVSGDFISFLMKKRDLDLREVMSLIKKELGIESFTYIKKENNSLFGGVYSRIRKPNKTRELKILNEDIISPFINKYSTKFFKDGISIKTQKKFQIGFDIETQRITIPWRDYEGNLVGVMGRYNGECDHDKRWLPVIPFPKRDLLYGYSYNYQYLHECDVLYLGESEKFTLQLDSFGINTTLSIGRSEISMSQIKKILSLNPKKIIYCLDEGLEKDIIIKNVDATKKLSRYNSIEIGYIYDDNNEFLEKGSKYSPSDLGKDVFMQLINNKLIRA